MLFYKQQTKSAASPEQESDASVNHQGDLNMTAKSSDDRLQKVQSFEVGKSYGGYVVESRTACFVTFEGCPRKKISIVDGVEQVNVDPSFSIAAFEEPTDSFDAYEPSDVEVYSPVATDDDSIVITDGATDWKLISVNEKTNNCVLVPANEAKDPDGRTVRLVALSVIQAIVAKPSVASAEASQQIRDRFLDLAECGIDHDQDPQDNFWTKYKVQLVPDFKTETVTEYKAKTESNSHAFNVGQTYEDVSGLKFKVTNRTGDTVELAAKFITLTKPVSVDDGGEFVQLGADRSSRFYAADTPSWFYDRDRELIRDFHFDRIRDREDADADRQGCI